MAARRMEATGSSEGPPSRLWRQSIFGYEHRRRGLGRLVPKRLSPPQLSANSAFASAEFWHTTGTPSPLRAKWRSRKRSLQNPQQSSYLSSRDDAMIRLTLAHRCRLSQRRSPSHRCNGRPATSVFENSRTASAEAAPRKASMSVVKMLILTTFEKSAPSEASTDFMFSST